MDKQRGGGSPNPFGTPQLGTPLGSIGGMGSVVGTPVSASGRGELRRRFYGISTCNADTSVRTEP